MNIKPPSFAFVATCLTGFPLAALATVLATGCSSSPGTASPGDTGSGSGIGPGSSSGTTSGSGSGSVPHGDAGTDGAGSSSGSSSGGSGSGSGSSSGGSGSGSSSGGSGSGSGSSSGGSGSSSGSGGGSSSGGPGATLVFNYPNGFANAAGAIQIDAELNGSEIDLTSTQRAAHQAGGAWYKEQQDIGSFTTDFTFQLNHTKYGMFFVVQNSNKTDMPNPWGYYGVNAFADANGEGYGAYEGLASQYPLVASVAIKFDQSEFNGNTYLTENASGPSTTGLYMNGGPSMNAQMGGFAPADDMLPYGLNLDSNDVFAAHIVYDGAFLTMTLEDTVTGGQMKKSYPVNIPAMVGGNKAWVGFVGGLVTPVVNEAVLSWDFYEGYATRLATPTISVPAGQYGSPQTVSITGPAGATIYYSTNGQLPTTASTKYSGPISVTASELVQAIAVQPGFTDSNVAAANYQIAPATAPLINFPNGFSGGSNLVALNGVAAFNGTAVRVTDTTIAWPGESGSAWYVAPVNVKSFQTQFTLDYPGGSGGNGMCFVIQNQLPSSQDVGGFPAWGGNLVVSGGINAVGFNAAGLGYQGILSSLCVKFDLYSNGGNATGLFTNGAVPDATGSDMSPVSLHSGHPITVALSYNGTTLSMTVTDAVNNNKYSTSWPIDIPSTVGGDTAYVGFTAATGGASANQEITAWTLSN